MADNLIVDGVWQAGAQNVKAIIRATETGGVYTLVVSSSGGGAVTSVNGDTGAVTLLPPDTGWQANADAGNKTISIAAYVAPNMAGLDTCDIMKIQDLANAFENLSAKLRAIENALANNVRPNA